MFSLIHRLPKRGASYHSSFNSSTLPNEYSETQICHHGSVNDCSHVSLDRQSFTGMKEKPNPDVNPLNSKSSYCRNSNEVVGINTLCTLALSGRTSDACGKQLQPSAQILQGPLPNRISIGCVFSSLPGSVSKPEKTNDHLVASLCQAGDDILAAVLSRGSENSDRECECRHQQFSVHNALVFARPSNAPVADHRSEGRWRFV